VCATSEVPEGEMRGFRVEGVTVPVLVTRVDGEFRACSGMCPHEDVELGGGSLSGLEVVCPGHGYCFDLENGACVPDDSLTLPIYRTWIEDGAVWIELFASPC